jgi:hypothetical protein
MTRNPLNSIESRFPGASQLFGAYFHQDWKSNGPTADHVVRTFAKAEGEATVLRTIKDIESLLIEFETEEELTAVLDRFGNSYNALRAESSCREWLTRTIGVLRFSRSKKPA